MLRLTETQPKSSARWCGKRDSLSSRFFFQMVTHAVMNLVQIGLNFSEQWEAGLSLLSSCAANNSLSFLGDVKVVKGELTHIKKFKLECPMEIFKKGMSGVEIILAWLSRVKSQARNSQCWLELLHWLRNNYTLKGSAKPWARRKAYDIWCRHE